MKQYISAPAPRMLLRLIMLLKILRQHNFIHTKQTQFCEIGPGLGDTSCLALDNFEIQEAHLYEFSSEARALLQQRFAEDNRVSVHDAFSPQNSYYDCIMCFEVLEHIEHDEAFIEDIFTSLNTQGLFIGSVPAYMKKWQDSDKFVGHFRRYEYQELKSKLESAGFSDIHLYTYGFPLINLLYPLHKLYYGRLLKNGAQSEMKTATAKSGISRDLVKSFNPSFVLYVVQFFSLFQSLPILSQLGDGFVFTCRKS